jgi:thiamine-phosphate pyrophosphorylase
MASHQPLTTNPTVLLCYITDRLQFPGNEHAQRERLLDKIAEAACSGVDFIQLRERELRSRELELLAHEAVHRIRAADGRTRLLINSRTDIALAAGADGVHLRSKDVSPEDVRKIWCEAHGPGEPVIAVSCHHDAEVVAAEQAGADFVVFGPVFDKKGPPEIRSTGLDALRETCNHKVPVLALGGVTAQNAALCARAGAAGIAAIRLFQAGELLAQIAALRG